MATQEAAVQAAKEFAGPSVNAARQNMGTQAEHIICNTLNSSSPAAVRASFAKGDQGFGVEQDPQKCSYCGKAQVALEEEGKKLKPCPCRRVQYCDTHCQKAHWVVHKLVCSCSRKALRKKTEEPKDPEQSRKKTEKPKDPEETTSDSGADLQSPSSRPVEAPTEYVTPIEEESVFNTPSHGSCRGRRLRRADSFEIIDALRIEDSPLSSPSQVRSRSAPPSR